MRYLAKCIGTYMYTYLYIYLKLMGRTEWERTNNVRATNNSRGSNIIRKLICRQWFFFKGKCLIPSLKHVKWMPICFLCSFLFFRLLLAEFQLFFTFLVTHLCMHEYMRIHIVQISATLWISYVCFLLLVDVCCVVFFFANLRLCC